MILCVSNSVSSDTVVANREKVDLKSQYEKRKQELEQKLPNAHKIVKCEEIEEVMFNWLNLKAYSWMKKTEKNGVLYPKIAVEARVEPKLEV